MGGCNNMIMTKPKKCKHCGKEFFPKKQAKTRHYCYECLPQENYSGSDLRKQIKRWGLEYKGSKCVLCGYDKCISALDFHHMNPQEKEFELSNRNIKLDWDIIKKELDKCIVVCANCHREIHSKEGD